MRFTKYPEITREHVASKASEVAALVAKSGVLTAYDLLIEDCPGYAINAAVERGLIAEIENGVYAEPWAAISPTYTELHSRAELEGEDLLHTHAVTLSAPARAAEAHAHFEQQIRDIPHKEETTSFWQELHLKACCEKYTLYTGSREACLKGAYELRQLSAKAEKLGDNGKWKLTIPGIGFDFAAAATEVA